MSVTIAHIFSASLLASAFDHTVSEQAAQGRTYAPLLTALDGAYGIQIPAATVGAIKYMNNNLFTLDKAPTLAKGVGAVAATVAVVQALHAYAVALRAGMADPAKAAPVADLPAWADPIAIAKKKAATKQANAAKKLDAEAAETGTDTDGEALAATLPPAMDTVAEMRTAWAKFAAFLDGGHITATERDSYIAMLEKAVTKAEPVPAKAKGKAKAKAKAANVPAPAAVQ